MEKIAIECKEKPAKYMMLSPNEAETALKDICNVSGVAFDIEQIEITKPFRQIGNKIIDSRYVVGFNIRADNPGEKEKSSLINRVKKQLVKAVSKNERALIKDSHAYFDKVYEKDRPVALSKDFGELDYSIKGNNDGSQTIWWMQGQVKNGVLDCSHIKKEQLRQSRIAGKRRGIHRKQAQRTTARSRTRTLV